MKNAANRGNFSWELTAAASLADKGTWSQEHIGPVATAIGSAPGAPRERLGSVSGARSDFGSELGSEPGAAGKS